MAQGVTPVGSGGGAPWRGIFDYQPRTHSARGQEKSPTRGSPSSPVMEVRSADRRGCGPNNGGTWQARQAGALVDSEVEGSADYGTEAQVLLAGGPEVYSQPKRPACEIPSIQIHSPTLAQVIDSQPNPSPNPSAHKASPVHIDPNPSLNPSAPPNLGPWPSTPDPLSQP
ncbi:hypothetical protein Salat_2624700 [Sesamum alatum]|uniref:Uncharacterized protein n=1 Tax=Sesamum alatum TaxID=300844 RepID=A0AAE2CAV8_9LAMI|nr:hypothetical protein Salat_2624700 [Sesamum alatum]